MNNYQTVILVSRNNVDCSSLSMDDFVQMMFSDILEAEENYNDLYVPDYVASIIRNYHSFVDSHRKQAIRYAENKWKTEKYRTAYINKAVEEAKKKYNMNKYYYQLSFFDFDVHPESNGLSGNCCLSIDRLTFDALRHCFEEIKDNYYFKNALGWTLEYECNDYDHHVCFRPHIKLILPDDVQAKYNKAQEDLTESVRKFYEGCHYWGD